MFVVNMRDCSRQTWSSRFFRFLCNIVGRRWCCSCWGAGWWCGRWSWSWRRRRRWWRCIGSSSSTAAGGCSWLWYCTFNWGIASTMFWYRHDLCSAKAQLTHIYKNLKQKECVWEAKEFSFSYHHAKNTWEMRRKFFFFLCETKIKCLLLLLVVRRPSFAE